MIQSTGNQAVKLFSQAPPGCKFVRPEGSPDKVTLDATADSHEDGHPGLLSRVGLAGALALTASTALLAGCSPSPQQMQPAEVVQSQPAQAETPEHNHIVSETGVMDFELSPTAQLKVDVVRQTHTETETSTDSDGHTTTDTKTVDDDLEPFGVNLGNGLFLDSDMNLSLVPDRIFHEPVIPQNFKHIDVTGPLGGWSKVSLDRSGSDVTIHQPLTPDMTVVHEGDQTTIHPFAKGPKSWQKFVDVTIARQGNVTTIHPWSHFDDITITRQDDGKMVVHEWGPKAFDTVISRQGNQVTVQPWGGKLSRTTVTQQGDQTQVHSLGWTETVSHQGNQLVSKPPLGFKSTITQDGNGQFTLKEGLGWSTHVKVQ